MTDILRSTLAAIDGANAADPARDEGEPAALVYGRRMSQTLAAFAPAASAHLAIACRGHHIERWTRPRTDWPDGLQGYLRWREALKVFHAERVSDIMLARGWQTTDAARVGAIIRKEGLKRDAEVQAFEDVICLTFIAWEFAAFAAKHPAEKVRDIVVKTGRKMSPAGRAAARATGLSEDIAKALDGN